MNNPLSKIFESISNMIDVWDEKNYLLYILLGLIVIVIYFVFFN